MLLAGFEPAIPASERPQTHALDGAATGIGTFVNYMSKFISIIWVLFLFQVLIIPIVQETSAV